MELSLIPASLSKSCFLPSLCDFLLRCERAFVESTKTNVKSQGSGLQVVFRGGPWAGLVAASVTCLTVVSDR